MELDVVLFAIIGIVVGALARLIVAGSDDTMILREERSSIWASLGVGVVGAFSGGIVGRVIGLYREGDSASYFMALAGATLALLAYHALVHRSVTF